MFCLDTDVLSAVVRRDPPLHLIRRLARTPPTEQCTTAITVGEPVYGVAPRGSSALADRVQALIESAGPVLPFDEAAVRRAARGARVERATAGRAARGVRAAPSPAR